MVATILSCTVDRKQREGNKMGPGIRYFEDPALVIFFLQTDPTS
jgi:hypothetical protein